MRKLLQFVHALQRRFFHTRISYTFTIILWLNCFLYKFMVNFESKETAMFPKNCNVSKEAGVILLPRIVSFETSIPISCYVLSLSLINMTTYLHNNWYVWSKFVEIFAWNFTFRVYFDSFLLLVVFMKNIAKFYENFLHICYKFRC